MGRASLTFVVWSTKAIRLRDDAPSTVSVPLVGEARPAMALSIVDLPEPLGPMSVVTALTGIVNDDVAIAI
jgi:hypothetical protein